MKNDWERLKFPVFYHLANEEIHLQLFRICMYKNDRKIYENLTLLASQWGKKKFWAHSSKKIKNFHWENEKKYSGCSLPYFFRYSHRILYEDNFQFYKKSQRKGWIFFMIYSGYILIIGFCKRNWEAKAKKISGYMFNIYKTTRTPCSLAGYWKWKSPTMLQLVKYRIL